MASKSTPKKKAAVKPAKKLTGWHNIGGVMFNMDGFAKISEQAAIDAHKHMPINRIINVWKQANGLK